MTTRQRSRAKMVYPAPRRIVQGRVGGAIRTFDSARRLCLAKPASHAYTRACLAHTLLQQCAEVVLKHCSAADRAAVASKGAVIARPGAGTACCFDPTVEQATARFLIYASTGMSGPPYRRDRRCIKRINHNTVANVVTRRRAHLRHQRHALPIALDVLSWHPFASFGLNFVHYRAAISNSCNVAREANGWVYGTAATHALATTSVAPLPLIR